MVSLHHHHNRHSQPPPPPLLPVLFFLLLLLRFPIAAVSPRVRPENSRLATREPREWNGSPEATSTAAATATSPRPVAGSWVTEREGW